MRGSRGNGEGSVYELKTGPNKGKWIAATPPVEGKRKTKVGRTRDEANRHLVEMMSDLHRGVPVSTDRQTVGHFLTEWLAEVQPTIKRSTYISYDNAINKWAIPYIGKIRLIELRREDIILFLRKAALRLQPTSVRKVRRILRIAIHSAVINRLIAQNPVTLVKPPLVHFQEVEPFTPSEVDVFLRAVEGHRLQALYSTAVVLGVRRGELLALRWRDIDFTNELIHIRQTLTVFKGGWEITEPKSGRGKRKILMPSVLVRHLKAHREAQQHLRALSKGLWQDYDMVFPTPVGAPMRPTTLTQNYNALLKQTALPRKRFHDLRHTAASIMIADNIPIKLVSEILGHSSVNTTLRIYAHLYDSQREIALARMEDRYKDY